MLSKISSATTWGITTHPVAVEVDLSFGMMQFYIVGLPDAAIRESRQRIATALKQCGIKLPERKITVNLAPADLKKEGTLFDLPIAFGILHAAQVVQVPQSFLEETLFLGELSLDGAVRPVKGILPIACDAAALGKKRLVVAPENAQEAAVVQGIEVLPVASIVQLIAHVRGEAVIKPLRLAPHDLSRNVDQYTYNVSDIKGQFAAKRALQIAAAGHHNLLFLGSPGAGKTMLAQRLLSLMPPMHFSEIIETSKIYSVSGKLPREGLTLDRPFRAPHHTISSAGLIGGGSIPQPGEISLAHNGVLFLDEFTEFKQSTIEALRQPLESHEVHIVRSQHAVSYPASFLLVAALNPCPCGFLEDKRRACTCSAEQIRRYMSKLSGPLIDRICLQVGVVSMSYDEVHTSVMPQVTSEQLYAGVLRAVAAQTERFQQLNVHRANEILWNSQIKAQDMESCCVLTDAARTVVKQAFDHLQLTMRSYHKLIRVARTIADIEGHELIGSVHIQEAMSYRLVDRMTGRRS